MVKQKIELKVGRRLNLQIMHWISGASFDNLLSNLLKYADRHEEIGITYVFDQEVFEIHIRNTIKAVEAPVESTKLGEKIMDKMMSRMLGQFSISNDGITYKSVLRFWNIKM